MDSKPLRQNLKKPDEFTTVVGNLFQSMVDRSREVLIGVAALLVFALALLGWQAWREVKDERAADALEKILEKSPSDATAWKATSEELKEFLKIYGRTTVARSARVYYAESLLKTGKSSEARKAFVEAAKIQKGKNKFLAEEGEAMALMDLKKYDEAEAIFAKLSKDQENPLRALHMWNLGLAQENGGKIPLALATYKEFQSTFPESPLLERVRSRESALKAAPPAKP